MDLQTTKTLSDIFSNVAFVDLLVCFILTIPVFVAYIIITAIYFSKSDKAVNSKTHGLSRFSLAGVFLIFGMIIADMNIEFVSAMLISLNTYGKLDLEELKPLMSSVMFLNFIEQYRNIPFGVLVMGNIFCTALYAGAEGVISAVKTLKVPVGMSIELPEMKRKRIKFIFLVWCAIAILSTVYTQIIGSEIITFEVAMCYSGVISTLIIIILADRSPTVLQNFTSSTTDSTSEVNMAEPSNEEVDTNINTGMDDAVDHVADAAVKILKRLNPGFEETEEPPKNKPPKKPHRNTHESDDVPPSSHGGDL